MSMSGVRTLNTSCPGCSVLLVLFSLAANKGIFHCYVFFFSFSLPKFLTSNLRSIAVEIQGFFFHGTHKMTTLKVLLWISGMSSPGNVLPFEIGLSESNTSVVWIL